jgi:hypothetical protein
MSPSGLHVLLKGSAPHPSTREKLVAWYVERGRADGFRPEVSSADADAALRLLVRYVRQTSRADTQAKRVREIVNRFESECSTDSE